MINENEEHKEQDEKEANFLIGVEIPLMVEQIRERYPFIAAIDKGQVAIIFSLGFECGARHFLETLKGAKKNESPE